MKKKGSLDSGLDTIRKFLIVALLILAFIVIVSGWIWLLGKGNTALPNAEPSGVVSGSKGINDFLKGLIFNFGKMW